MRKSTKKLLLRRFLFVLILLIGHILQNTQGFFPEFFGSRAYLLITLTVCIGMFEREISGAALGLFAGALWDSVSGLGDGFDALFLMLIGAASGLLINLLMRNNLFTALLLNSVAHLLYVTIYVVLFVFAEGVDSILYLFVRFYLPTCVYSVVLTPIFYLLVRFIMKKTKIEE